MQHRWVFLVFYLLFSGLEAIAAPDPWNTVGTSQEPTSPAATSGKSQCASCPNASVKSNGDEYSPASAADLTNPANAGRTAVISNSFDISGATLAPNQILIPSGGALSGTNIDLNGAQIVLNHEQLFDANARFTTSYEGCLSPEHFGAAASPEDSGAFEAVADNAAIGYGQPATTYNINRPLPFQDHEDDFDKTSWAWLGNGCTISSRFASHSRTNQDGISNADVRNTPTNSWFSNEDYLFTFLGVDITSWCDTTIEGNGILHFGILTDANFYAFNSKWLNFGNDEQNERCLMVNAWVDSRVVDRLVFDSCEFNTAIPNDPASEIGNAAGLSRGILYNLSDASTDRLYTVHNSDFHSFYGEGEGVHWFPAEVGQGAGWNHPLKLRILNSRFSDCSRRSIKSQTSGLQIDGCTFEKIDSKSPHAKKATVNVGLAIASANGIDQYCINSYVKNSRFTMVPGETGWRAWHLALTAVRGAEVSGNTFEGPFIGMAAIALDTNAEDNRIFNNTFTDICAVTGYTQSPGTYKMNLVYDNTINATIDRGSRHFSAFGQPLVIMAPPRPASFRRFHIYNNDITLTFNSASTRAHVLGTDPERDMWDGHIFDSIILDGNRITYRGPHAPNKKVLDIGGDFGPSNAFINHNPAVGVTASGALKVDGIQTFTARNNANGSGEELTKE